jgi:hypothetical protein
MSWSKLSVLAWLEKVFKKPQERELCEEEEEELEEDWYSLDQNLCRLRRTW